MRSIPHQYIERDTGRVCTEPLFGDRFVKLLYSPVQENAPRLFRMLTSHRMSAVLGYLNYDAPLGARMTGGRRFLRSSGVDLSECADPRETLDTPRKIFERKIRYWELRLMFDDPSIVASSADARVLLGSFRHGSPLHIKEKFFDYAELFGIDKAEWLEAFAGGDFAVFRLTPDKYHYNHAPVSGKVLDLYALGNDCHSCNPEAVVSTVTPYSKNKRVVTVLDTDVDGGTGAGLVAVIEIGALMIADLVQCYSEVRYDDPQPVAPGMFLNKGQPKSLYRPGGSTDVLVFQRDRVRFDDDLRRNMRRNDVSSRYSLGFGRPLVETDVRVRSAIAHALRKEERNPV
jgi:phosphatidylserine decarboxylase